MFSHFQAEYQEPQVVPPTIADNARQPHGTDLIGRPILFVSGQFKDKTIRAELREVQQAMLGRKYARVDRRPLDPPPVVHLRLFQVFHVGTEQETETEIEDYEEVQVLGLLCTVDLFPISSGQNGPPKNATGSAHSQPTSPTQAVFPATPGPSRHPIDNRQQEFTFSAPAARFSMPQSFDRHITPPTQPTSAHETSPAPVLLPQHTTSGNDIVHYVNDTAITEGSKMTYALVGAKFVQPHVVELLSKKAIVFVFADLAVKVEGQFILRYRVFDIFSRPSSYTDLAVQAECYGGSFRVYSTKEFPGLPASTELTKQLARWGVRLNTRETERRRRKKGEARSSSPPYAGTARKRKHASPSDNAETAEGSDEDEE